MPRERTHQITVRTDRTNAIPMRQVVTVPMLSARSTTVPTAQIAR